MGTFLIIVAGLAIVLTGDVPSVALLLLGVALVSGVLGGLLTALGLRRRPDLLAAEAGVEADALGVRLSYLGVTSEVAWSAFRRVRDTGTALLFDFGTGAVTFVPCRAFDTAQLAALRGLARDGGVLDRRGSAGPMMSGVMMGALAAIVFIIVVVAIGVQTAPA
jgi:hypothetical protein